jgi:ABC-type lipoprotein export system ATPase subunit
MLSWAVRLLPPRGSGKTAVLKSAVSLRPPIAEERRVPRADLTRIVARRLPVSACGR